DHITIPFDGDVNNDGVVDAFDLNLLASHWNQTGAGRSLGDMTGDGTIDRADSALLDAHWQAGATQFSNELTLQEANIPPTVDAITPLPADPAASSTIQLSINSHDPENNAISYDIQWLRNGQPIAGETSTTLDLTALGAVPGDVIQARITPIDGKNH